MRPSYIFMAGIAALGVSGLALQFSEAAKKADAACQAIQGKDRHDCEYVTVRKEVDVRELRLKPAAEPN